MARPTVARRLLRDRSRLPLARVSTRRSTAGGLGGLRAPQIPHFFLTFSRPIHASTAVGFVSHDRPERQRMETSVNSRPLASTTVGSFSRFALATPPRRYATVHEPRGGFVSPFRNRAPHANSSERRTAPAPAGRPGFATELRSTFRTRTPALRPGRCETTANTTPIQLPKSPRARRPRHRPPPRAAPARQSYRPPRRKSAIFRRAACIPLDRACQLGGADIAVFPEQAEAAAISELVT